MADAKEIDRYDFLSEKEHIQKRAMWLGNKQQAELLCWVLNDSGNEPLLRRKILISEALLKCVDEIIVNACDQAVRAILEPSNTGGPVRRIDVFLDKDTGEVSVRNDGRGMGVYWSKKIGAWSVQGIVSRTYSGTNFDDNPDQVTGGINGLGMKLININSEYFTVETVDLTRKRYYKQTCHSRPDKETLDIDPPLVVDLESGRCLGDEEVPSATKHALETAERGSHTTITFLPRYTLLCAGTKAWLSAGNLRLFEQAIRGRLCLLSAFLGTIGYRYVGGAYHKEKLDAEEYQDWQRRMGIDEEEDKVGGSPKKTKSTHTIYRYMDGDDGARVEYDTRARVYFQGKAIPVTNITELSARVLPRGEPRVAITLESRTNAVPYPWYLVVSLSHADGKRQTGEFQQLSIVNGIYMEEGGTHVTALVGKLTTALLGIAHTKADWLARDALKEMLRKMLYVINLRQIPVPQMSSQSKTELKLGREQQYHIRDTYMFSSEQVAAVWELLAQRFADLQLKKELDDQRKTISRLRVREAQHAFHANRRTEWPKNRMLINEGDSAQQCTDQIITSKNSPISRDNMATYNTRGVPPNALKEVRAVSGQRLLMSRMLQNNVVLQGLRVALGLEFDKQYWFQGDADPEAFTAEERKLRAQGDREFAELPYGGGIIIATDQDQDGIGQICSLLLIFFITFWPELVKRRYLHRLMTPLVRVFEPTGGKGPKRVSRFYTEREFKEAMRLKYGSENDIPKTVDVIYYKGLGSNSENDITKEMAPMFEELVVTFTWDDATQHMAETLYGKNATLRKPLLLSPVTQEYGPAYAARREASCSEHFAIEAVSFQQEFAGRKLKSAVDGLIPSQRKALAGARRPEVRNKKELRVYQISGAVTSSMAYHHGDASMNDVIIKMTQAFPGSNQIPVFMPFSSGVGGRDKGRDQNAGARYILTAYNARAMDLLFPPRDDCLLEPEFADGEEVEPRYYVPIAPYAILETSTTTAAGWNINVWARDRQRVWDVLDRMIRQSWTPDDPVPANLFGCPALLPGQQCFLSPGVEIVVGEYTQDVEKDTVHITQLPPKQWSLVLAGQWRGRTWKGDIKYDKHGAPLPGKPLVESVEDNTDHYTVNMLVRFKDGGVRRVLRGLAETDSAQQNGETDDEEADEEADEEEAPAAPLSASVRERLAPMDRYLGLYTLMTPNLNLLCAEGTVREFETYEEILCYWFPLRRRLYEQRLERELILLELQILLLRETIRYIEEEEAKKIVINRDIDSAERYQRLQARGYWRFNTALLNKPGRIPLHELRARIASQAATTTREDEDGEDDTTLGYAYIERITTAMRSKARLNTLQRELLALEARLAEQRKLTWKKVWLQELKALDEVIREGERTRWVFERDEYVYGVDETKATKAPKAKPPKAAARPRKAKK